ncbi:MAG TPA: preprotein translocase subunit YajC [Acidobacteriaceae bacterium]|nr:preprotein translocase subunit YajC [Acidobacteriaceae bacterium]
MTPIALLAPLALPAGFASFLPFLLIIVFVYFLMMRPQQKRQQRWQQMLGSLKPGDRITTSGGIRGVILSIKDDVIQMRIPPDNLRIEIVKSAVASVTAPDETR